MNKTQLRKYIKGIQYEATIKYNRKCAELDISLPKGVISKQLDTDETTLLDRAFTAVIEVIDLIDLDLEGFSMCGSAISKVKSNINSMYTTEGLTKLDYGVASNRYRGNKTHKAYVKATVAHKKIQDELNNILLNLSSMTAKQGVVYLEEMGFDLSPIGIPQAGTAIAVQVDTDFIKKMNGA